jgi:CheY-like chemotaxis protein
VINLNDLVLGTMKLLRPLIGEDIDMAALLAPDLGLVKADPSQFEQILMNLAVNARDAMPLGGKLTIETQNVVLDAEYARHHTDVVPGPHVLLAVSDVGIGMSETTQAHIFEPFYTTKEPGKGTGLGLAVCHGIVSQAGGHIWVYSELGVGTTFKIFLPQVVSQAALAAPTAVDTPTCGGSETLLLVEDEPLVRELAVQALRGHGYRVLVAKNGNEALAIVSDHAAALDLLITDVVLPQMSGRQLAGQLGAVLPGLKVLYVSGYAEHTIVHHGVLDEGVAFLPKPFTPGVLVRKVREVLDAARWNE